MPIIKSSIPVFNLSLVLADTSSTQKYFTSTASGPTPTTSGLTSPTSTYSMSVHVDVIGAALPVGLQTYLYLTFVIHIQPAVGRNDLTFLSEIIFPTNIVSDTLPKLKR